MEEFPQTPATHPLPREQAFDEARIQSEISGTGGGTDPFAAAVRATRMPMIITDPRLPDNPIVFVNEAFCRLTGYPREEIVGFNCRFLQGPETDRAAVDRIRKAIATPTSIEIELRNHRKDGTPFVNRLLIAPVHDAAGKLTYFFASQLDDTPDERRLAVLDAEHATLLAEREASLNHLDITEQSLRLAIEAAELGTWYLDVATNVMTWSDRTKAMFGISPDVPCTMDDFYGGLHPDDLVATGKAFASALDPDVRTTYDVEYRTIGKEDGRVRWVAAKGKGLFGPDGRCVRILGTAIDITERRQTQERLARSEAELRDLNANLERRVDERTAELEKAQEGLRQSQKMEAVGQLTGGLAHDFNNLLAGISGSLELMQTRMQQGRFNDVERYMAAAQGASKRAAALTHRLLAFSRRQTLDPKPTDVNRLVEGMQEMIQRTVGPGIPVEVVGVSGLWPALVDPSQLENALLNLCINARDAMPDGGRITVETANKWLDERAARQHDMPEGQYLALSVSDTGTGMPPEVVARVFEPFFTTKPIGEGTGLGLSMIYGFAQQSGGQVRIYSEVGAGTTVRIYLPRHYGEVAEEAEVVKLEALPQSEQGETVLVVDDEPTVRMLVADILDDLGYTALEAGDSAAGLKILNSDVRIDLLITDVGLPGGMNGRQMADAGRVRRPDLKVLFITGYAENAVLGNGHLAPGMAVLTKPFAMDAMATRIRSMIEANREAMLKRSVVDRRPEP